MSATTTIFNARVFCDRFGRETLLVLERVGREFRILECSEGACSLAGLSSHPGEIDSMWTETVSRFRVQDCEESWLSPADAERVLGGTVVLSPQDYDLADSEYTS